jgi:[acyl-carrier-protein] S-malonyltransferase
MEAMRVAITFPGQGTQTPGMARSWQGHDAWSIVDEAEAALGERLAALITDADDATLARTRSAQLAVLLTSLIAWEAARDRITARHDIVAFGGHSLGQVTAMIASSAMSLADGVRFAARRAELTQVAADAHPGRMAALLGATPESARAACAASAGTAWVANDNAPGQIVIAGTAEGLERAIQRAKELGVKRAMSLNVGGAFHTPLMASARDGLTEALAEIDFAVPTAPVVSNADAVAYIDTNGWRDRLAEHPLLPVRWRDCMLTFTAAPLLATTFFEIGYGSMIAGVAKRTVPDAAVIGLATPDDLEFLDTLQQESRKVT